MKLNDIEIEKKEVAVEILPFFFTEDEKEQSANGIVVYRKGTEYRYSMPFFANEKNEFFEDLLVKYTPTYKNMDRSFFIATSLVHQFDDWFFEGIEDYLDNGQYVLKIGSEENEDSILIETDVFEYGILAALEISQLINNNSKEEA